MTPAQQAEIAALVTAQAASREELSSTAAAVVGSEVARFEDWRSSTAITALTKRIVPEVEAIQRRTASLTSVYLARVASLQRGRRAAPARTVNVTRLRGIPHADVYGRLADQYRYLRSIDVAPDIAQERVVARGELLAETDATLAMRAQSRDFMIVNSVDGFRRVLRPELSHKTGVCALCVVAADRIYHREDLLPIHDGCNCAVLPILNGVDPGHALNTEDIAAIYKAAGSNRAGDLIKVRIRVDDHGELGPILTNAAQAWRSATDVAAAAKAA